MKLYVRSEDEKRYESEISSLAASVTNDSESLKMMVCLTNMRTVPGLMNVIY